MATSTKRTPSTPIVFIIALFISMIPTNTHAFSLRDARELVKQHRFKLLAITSAAVFFMYTNKLIKKAIQEYKNTQKGELKKDSKMSVQEYAEGFSDAFIKATKLIGTLFKVLRAVTCPYDGKTASDQCLDDLSQLA